MGVQIYICSCLLISDLLVVAYCVFWLRGDVVEIETWCQGEGKIGTRRDWILKDLATGEVIGRATRYVSYLYLLFSLFIHQ